MKGVTKHLTEGLIQGLMLFGHPTGLYPIALASCVCVCVCGLVTFSALPLPPFLTTLYRVIFFMSPPGHSKIFRGFEYYLSVPFFLNPVFPGFDRASMRWTSRIAKRLKLSIGRSSISLRPKRSRCPSFPSPISSSCYRTYSPPPPSWPPSPPRKKKEQLTQSQTRTAAAPTAELTKRRSASVSGTTPLIGPRGGVGFPPHSTPSPVWYRKWFKAFPWRRQNECSAADWCTLTSCLLLGTSLVVGHFVR